MRFQPLDHPQENKAADVKSCNKHLFSIDRANDQALGCLLSRVKVFEVIIEVVLNTVLEQAFTLVFGVLVFVGIVVA